MNSILLHSFSAANILGGAEFVFLVDVFHVAGYFVTFADILVSAVDAENVKPALFGGGGLF